MLVLHTSPTHASISLFLLSLLCELYSFYWSGRSGKSSVTNLSLGSKSLVGSESRCMHWFCVGFETLEWRYEAMMFSKDWSTEQSLDSSLLDVFSWWLCSSLSLGRTSDLFFCCRRSLTLKLVSFIWLFFKFRKWLESTLQEDCCKKGFQMAHKIKWEDFLLSLHF